MRDFVTFMITIFVAGWGSAVLYTVLRFFWARQNQSSLPRGDERMLRYRTIAGPDPLLLARKGRLWRTKEGSEETDSIPPAGACGARSRR